jgi:hypothetical protein
LRYHDNKPGKSTLRRFQSLTSHLWPTQKTPFSWVAITASQKKRGRSHAFGLFAIANLRCCAGRFRGFESALRHLGESCETGRVVRRDVG